MDLIVILDDATSEIYYAQLVDQESTRTVMAAIRHVVETKGWFSSLYSDRASHFFRTPKAGDHGQTQFSAGLNVHPEDLEATLKKQPAIRDAVVVSLNRDNNSEPCAILLPRNEVQEVNEVDKEVAAAIALEQQGHEPARPLELLNW